jgi:hypothetical protein
MFSSTPSFGINTNWIAADNSSSFTIKREVKICLRKQAQVYC